MDALKLLDVESNLPETVGFEEVVDFIRMLERFRREHANRGKRNAMLLEELDPVHYTLMGATARTRHPLLIVQERRTVDAHPDADIKLSEKPTVIIINKNCVGLKVLDNTTRISD